MPSERFRYRSKKVTPIEEFGLGEAVEFLTMENPAVITELIYIRLEADESFRRKILVRVLASKLPPAHTESELTLFFEQLAELCDFEAEWRDSDHGWAQFLDEVATAVEKIVRHTPLVKDPRIAAIIEVAEESSHQIDDCYACDTEIERLSKIFDGVDREPTSQP